MSEYANDLDGELANFWTVLQDPIFFSDFFRYVEATPLWDVEFKRAGQSLGTNNTHTARAIRFFIRNRQSRQGLGKDFCTPTSRLRRGMNENVSAWLSAVEGLPAVHSRLKRVEIRNQDACDLIRELDSPDTFFYCDPPYYHGSRVVTDTYRHEMTELDHRHLLETLRGIKGKFLLSGYDSELYREAEESFHAYSPHWRRVAEFKIDNKASSKKTKPIMTECLWANYEIQAV